MKAWKEVLSSSALSLGAPDSCELVRMRGEKCSTIQMNGQFAGAHAIRPPPSVPKCLGGRSEPAGSVRATPRTPHGYIRVI